jgi:hypothetical protein
MEHTHSLEARHPNDVAVGQTKRQHGEPVDPNRRASLDSELGDRVERDRQSPAARSELDAIAQQLEASGVELPIERPEYGDRSFHMAHGTALRRPLHPRRDGSCLRLSRYDRADGSG